MTWSPGWDNHVRIKSSRLRHRRTVGDRWSEAFGDGGMYALITSGNVYCMASATGSVYLDDDVQSIATAGDGGVYGLFAGNRDRRAAGPWQLGHDAIHARLQSIACGPRGVSSRVVHVDPEDEMSTPYNYGTGWTTVTSSKRFFAAWWRLPHSTFCLPTTARTRAR